MGTYYPSCVTTVSPFSEYNSNKINELTDMISFGENCFRFTNSCNVSIDSTSTLSVTTGSFFKDKCFHYINTEFIVDMDDPDFYYDSSAGYFNEEGYYFLTLHYVYEKTKPAPQVSVKIFKPSQLESYDADDFLFLKCISVVYNSIDFNITEIYDYYPDDPTIKKSYAKTYIDTEFSLPTFDASRDDGRLLYIKTTGDMYFGNSLEWQNISKSNIVTKTDTYQILISDLGKKFRMNSSNDKIFYLPTASTEEIYVPDGLSEVFDGSTLSFFKQGSGKLTIDCEAGFTIMDSGDGGIIYSTDDYAYIVLEYIHALKKYVIISSSGTWTTT